MQVAVIAPTTLLARQHFQTFSERFAGWPIKVRHLSRFVTAKEAAETTDEIGKGECDVVVGTHALLGKGIDFKRLGMIVVDEEQRFGVKHKERLKELKADVHVLTLSATPIPRTLQMALTGIRDLSIIATPPVDRLAVRTYVVEFDPVTIREALLRERYRGGQSYFVAPRVADLPFLERYLREQVPEVIVPDGARADDARRIWKTGWSAFYDGQGGCAAVDHHRGIRDRHSARQHADHPPRGHVRAGAALSAARARGAGEAASVRVSDDAVGREADGWGGQAAEGSAIARQPRRGLHAGEPRSGYARRRQPAGR